MKTFIVAICLMALTFGFVIWNTLDLQRSYREMLTLAESLPLEASDFKKDAETTAAVEELYRLWEKTFPRIALASGADTYNRADEALRSLFIHYQNDNAGDFTHARLLFWNSLHRLCYHPFSF